MIRLDSDSLARIRAVGNFKERPVSWGVEKVSANALIAAMCPAIVVRTIGVSEVDGPIWTTCQTVTGKHAQASGSLCIIVRAGHSLKIDSLVLSHVDVPTTLLCMNEKP